MPSSKGRKLIVLGQTPPPFHGQAKAIQAMIDYLRDDFEIIHVPMRFSEAVTENGNFRFRKLIHLLSVICKSLWYLIRNPRSILYYPPAPGAWVPVLRDLAILMLVRPFAASTIFHFHAHGLGKFLSRHWWLRKLTWAWNRPDIAIVIGNSSISDATKIDPKRTVVVPNGINVELAERKRDAKRIRVLYVGILTESKGLLDILHTAKLLSDLDIEFRLVGAFKSQEDRQEFERTRTELRLVSMVEAVGERTGVDLAQEYADADIFFFPTFYEGETFGLVLIEAMANSLPVVASRWRGPVDVIDDGNSGTLCNPRDICAYADAICQQVLSPTQREEMGRRGREVYDARYRLPIHIAALRQVFTEAGCTRRAIRVLGREDSAQPAAVATCGCGDPDHSHSHFG